MFGKIERLLMAALLACVAVHCRAADGETGQFGVRLSGGYGFSLSDEVDDNTSYQPQTVPLSSGVVSAAELIYHFTPALGLDLGMYPDFASRPERAWSYIKNVNDYATFYPVLLGLEVQEPLVQGTDVLASVGFGVVPSTTLFRPAVAPATGSENSYYNAALAVRFYLGVRQSLGAHLGLLLGVQYLAFDQKDYSYSTGGDGHSTDDFNELGPLLGVDWMF